MAARPEGNDLDYQSMAEFRYQIRRFLRFSEEAARVEGLKPQQYQMLLIIKGMPEGTRGRIGEVAERLQIQHHSTVELADRLVSRGLVRRKRAAEDRREVVLELTAKGEKVLRELAVHHRDELRNAAPALVGALNRIVKTGSKPAGGAGPRRPKIKQESPD